jgi:hypothetical protein
LADAFFSSWFIQSLKQRSFADIASQQKYALHERALTLIHNEKKEGAELTKKPRDQQQTFYSMHVTPVSPYLGVTVQKIPSNLSTKRLN